MAAALVIDVYVDLVCPWCLIGKRHLDQAVALFREATPGTTVQVRWHSVQLLPDAPAQGWDFEAFYQKRLGSGLKARQAQVNAAAQAVGFQIDFGNIPRMPNTLQAHQLFGFASTRLSSPQFAQLLEQLFQVHFFLGGNLGERALLLRIASGLGLDLADLEAWLASGAGKPRAQDVPGVPFFIFNQQQALSGAQPAAALLDAMRQACAAHDAALQL